MSSVVADGGPEREGDRTYRGELYAIYLLLMENPADLREKKGTAPPNRINSRTFIQQTQ